MTGLVSMVWRRSAIVLIRLLVGARGDWRGAAPVPVQRIYFANHCSHADTLAVMAALPWELRRRTRPVAARDYWGRTALSRFMAEKILRAILIDRQPPARALTTVDPLAPVASAMAVGASILVFPEGTRGDGSEIAAFRPGLYHLARRFPSVELVPVFLDNLARIMPKGSMLPVPITCTARFGAPIHLGEEEGRQAFLDRARAAVASLADPRSEGRP